ncbi:MAG: hypothetical protein U0T73_06290 [Chitinophagales bacterium]
MEWLRGDLVIRSGVEVSAEDIADGIALLEISPEEKSMYSAALIRYYKRNPSYFLIAFEKQKAVGFFFCLPIATAYAEAWKGGAHDEAFDKLQFPDEAIVPLWFKGDHALLFEVIHVNKSAGLANSAIMYALMQSFADLLIAQAKEGIFINGFYADAFNEEGVQLGRILGLQKYRATPSGFLYITPGIPQKLLQFTAADRPQLQQLYAGYFSASGSR